MIKTNNRLQYYITKLVSILLVLVTLLSLFTWIPFRVSAASTSVTPTVYSQLSDTSAYNYPGGSGSTYKSSGCGVYAVVNAVKYLTGEKIDPHELGEFAISCGARVDGGTLGATLCKKAASSDKFGGAYGFSLAEIYTFGSSSRTMRCDIGGEKTASGYPSTAEWDVLYSKLVSHLENGEVAVVLVMGHYMAIVDYDDSTGKFLMLDSAAYTSKRLSQNKGKWQWVTADQLNYNKAPKANSSYNNQGPYIHLRSEIMFLTKVGGNSNNNTTQNSINPDSYPICERDLVYNSSIEKGNDVKWVQCILKHLGYSIDIDGSYGPSSRDTIKKFQSDYGLTVDGQCGPNTRAKLKEVWASKGHIWNSGTVVTDATHTATGTKEFKCNYCEATKTETIAKLTGHTYSSWEKHDSLLHKKTCLCGDTQYANHTWNSGIVTTQSTCTATGLRTYTCTGCNATKTEAISVKGHNYGSWQNHNSTQHKKTCSCGDIQYANHTWNSGTTTKAATHTEEGIKTYTCTGCNATKTEAIAKLSGHTYGAWENYDRLQHKRVCACGSYEFSDHSWDNGIITTPATNTKEGTKTFTCLNCNAKKTESVPKIENSDTVAKIIVSNHEVAANGTIKVTISIKENPGVASIILQIAYDNSLLTLTSVEYNSTIGGQTVNPSNLSSPVTLYWINAFENMSGDVVFATLTFKADENSMVGASSNIVISYNAEDIYNIDEENVSLDIQNGTVTIIDYVPGDINGDGELNNKDVSRLMQYFAGWDVEVNEATLDVNGDGLLNNKDASRLMQYLVGWDVDIY